MQITTLRAQPLEVSMIEARGLVKHYRSTPAVDNLSFDVRPGTVTGFLGPNGAGKSTTMRMIMGLDRPDAGQVRIGGKSYGDLRWPLREVGALLEAKAFHPGPPDRAGRQQRDRPAAGRGGARQHRDREGRGPPGREVLARHVPAAGHRRRPARRPGGPAARRAGQRPGPRRHPLDPRPAEEPRRPGPDGAGLQPPHQRDRAHRGRAHRDRPGPAARADHGHPAVRPRRLAGRSVLPANRRRHRLFREPVMNTATLSHRAARPARGGYGLRTVARMEWQRLRTVRSTWYIVAIFAACMIGLAVLAVGHGNYAQMFAAGRASFYPTRDAFLGLVLGQLLLGVLGVLAITTEFSSGMIRATFAAAPRR